MERKEFLSATFSIAITLCSPAVLSAASSREVKQPGVSSLKMHAHEALHGITNLSRMETLNLKETVTTLTYLGLLCELSSQHGLLILKPNLVVEQLRREVGRALDSGVKNQRAWAVFNDPRAARFMSEGDQERLAIKYRTHVKKDLRRRFEKAIQEVESRW